MRGFEFRAGVMIGRGDDDAILFFYSCLDCESSMMPSQANIGATSAMR